MAKRFQVVIVGGGPVGVALAVQLGMRGMTCGLVETRTDSGRIPKGQNLTHRTLETFYFMGLLDELRAARLMPPGFAIGEITTYRDLNSPYFHAPQGRSMVHDYYFQRNDRLPQYQMEKVLRAKMDALPGVESRFGWTAKTIEQDAQGVRVTIEKDSQKETWEADYVVGCDGGHSLVREQIGIARGGTDFDELMVLIVFRSKEFHEGLKQRYPERSTYRAMHPDLKGYWKFFGRIDVGEGFFFHAPVPKTTTRENFDFTRMLHEAAGFPFKVEYDHVGFWDLRVAVAEKYQVGRCFIAGDAAHSHPPYGGFGLNNGLEDAVNLGWKLAAKLQGWGGDTLLESYSEERRPIFYEVAEDFIAKRIRIDGAFLDRYNPERDKAEFERAWKEKETDMDNRALVYEPSYEGSPVVFGPPGGKSTAHGEHVFKARSGHHLAPQKLSSGRNVFEELGPGFTLLAFDAGDAAVKAFEQAAVATKVPLKVVRDTYADGRTKYEARMILVRPDQFIVWTGNTAPDNATHVMHTVAGRGPVM
ncbi:FAD-dependent monooxygenase [Rhodoplanes sp. Z2-YC6860]|uniref:FAD-dependent monooxygenase n=1 Tax=Rhodoplanes sp. Z2-YC6860 TaxID=674703 RepID=UPI00078E8D4A|nr:FAD-dependent monooxygenase [Rhodoplanes sp. Z2-YC6860]AMN40091.1 Monooxygenase, FAD-binding [Rhodoplanes sp. Z2-YC6860]